MVMTPFFMGNETFTSYTRGQNYGAQISFSIPLDWSMINTCKDLAEKKAQAAALDMAFIRFRECTKLFDAGYMISPKSPFYKACSDITPIPTGKGYAPVNAPLNTTPEN